MRLCLIVSALCVAQLAAGPVEQKTVKSDGHDYKVVCYYGSWAVYRPGSGKYPVEEIDPFLCTHLIYGFAGLGQDNRIKSLDSWNDLKEHYGRGAFERFTTALKAKNPKLKTIIAIGGWNEGSMKYSAMAASAASRKIFVDSVVAFCKQYNFDGLDMDWEYPASRGGKPQDKVNFIALLKDLKQALQKENLLLTAAVSAGKHFIDPAYDIPQVSKYLDLINLMAYDFHGGWETKAGHHSPIFSRPEEPAEDHILNLNYSVNYWLSQGACPQKLILGMGLYGRSFTLRRAEDHQPGDEAPQKGMAGPYTREAGSLGYNEICASIKQGGWTIEQDPFFMAPFAYKGRQWVGYDDIASIELKTRFAKSLGLGGGMVWSIETDDFKGTCHGYRYPLISAINRVFAEPGIPALPVPPPAPSTTPAPPTTPSTKPTWWPRPTTSTMAPSPQPTTKPATATTAAATTTAKTTTTTAAAAAKTTAKPTTTKPKTATKTTAAKPTTSSPTTVAPVDGGNGGAKINCTSQGRFRDRSNCRVFYECVRSNNGLKAFRKECGAGTVFNPVNGLCAWPYDVPGCKDYVGPVDEDVKQEIAAS